MMLRGEVTSDGPRVRLLRGVSIAVAAGVGVLGIGLLGLTLWTVISAVVLFHMAHDRYQASEVRPLQHLITLGLPVGTRAGQARMVLRSAGVSTFIAGRGFSPLVLDASVHRVRSFNPDREESEVYPSGMALFANAREAGNGTLFSERTLTIWLYFDAAGRFTHCTVDEYLALF